MNGLHRGDHALRGKKRPISEPEVLRMLDAKAMIFSRAGERCKYLQHCRIGAITNRMDIDLPLVPSRRSNELSERIQIISQYTRRIGRVAVGRMQPRRARAQRAIRLDLDRADGESVITLSQKRTARQPFVQCGLIAGQHHGVKTND